MVVVGALLIVVAHVLNAWGILQKDDIKETDEIPTSIVGHRQEDIKKNKKIYWRPNVAHITRDLAPVGNGILQATQNFKDRRFSVA